MHGVYWYVHSPADKERSGQAHDSQRISGDALDGVYQRSIEFPQYEEAGTWFITAVYLGDNVGNTREYREQDLIALGFPTELEVMSAIEDTQPPHLLEFDFSPKSINTGAGSQSVTFTLRVTDDISGVYGVGWYVQSPSSKERSALILEFVSGDGLDGVYQDSIEFPQYEELGTWHVTNVHLTDNVGNHREYWEQDLIDLSFPTELTNG